MLGDKYAGSRFSVELGKLQVETLQSVSGLATGFDVVETKQIGKNGQTIIRKQAEGEQNGDINIVRGLDKSRAFTEWVEKTLVQRKPDEEQPNLTVTQHDQQGRTAHRVTLIGACATRWDGAGLDASSGEQPKETVTIAYSDLIVE
ncbi:phage tail protein [Streptomyces sp. NPDC059874]|uniref:phage tail protein n=1 Tax=Streptomyces sp. NPDC059874 TaxID=3346983 RepID=UPI00364632F8